MPTHRVQVNLRLKPALRERLQKAADEKGVSMTREITDRLERSFIQSGFEGLQLSDTAARVGAVMAVTFDRGGWLSAYASALGDETLEGEIVDEKKIITAAHAAEGWFNDAWSYNQAKLAVATMLDLLKPRQGKARDPVRMPPSLDAAEIETIGETIATDLMNEALRGPKDPTPEAMARAARLRDLIGHLVIAAKGEGRLINAMIESAQRPAATVEKDPKS